MGFDREQFIWRGLDLYFGRRTKPVLTLVPDATYPHLFRITYPDGWSSRPANITRAKDAAYDHARHLLVDRARQERRTAPKAISLTLGAASRSPDQFNPQRRRTENEHDQKRT